MLLVVICRPKHGQIVAETHINMSPLTKLVFLYEAHKPQTPFGLGL